METPDLDYAVSETILNGTCPSRPAEAAADGPTCPDGGIRFREFHAIRRPSAIRDSATPAVFHERTARTILGAVEQGWRYRSCQMNRGDCLSEVTHLAN